MKRITDRCTYETLCPTGAGLFLAFNSEPKNSAQAKSIGAEYSAHVRACMHSQGAQPMVYPKWVGEAAARALLEES